MHETIKNFHKQFEYKPRIENSERLESLKLDKFIIAGVGGSNLVADLLKIRDPDVDIVVHRDYGLPVLVDAELKKRLIIANSYSGDTEETLSSFEKAFKKKLSLVAIATGGKLIELAQKHKIPYIQMPKTGIQPRAALGFNLRAILKVMDREDLLQETGEELASSLHTEAYENTGKELAEKLKGHIPIIYTSANNVGVAYNWKIKFNETGKIPAFYNVLPELNHNEMTGFDIIDSTKQLSEKFHFIFLKDMGDHPGILKRMGILEKLYQDRGLAVEVIQLEGNNIWLKIFSSLILADWTAYYTAQIYGAEPEQVPMVEEFKKLIK